jgi:hypothetical protein
LNKNVFSLFLLYHFCKKSKNPAFLGAGRGCSDELVIATDVSLLVG